MLDGRYKNIQLCFQQRPNEGIFHVFVTFLTPFVLPGRLQSSGCAAGSPPSFTAIASLKSKLSCALAFLLWILQQVIPTVQTCFLTVSLKKTTTKKNNWCFSVLRIDSNNLPTSSTNQQDTVEAFHQNLQKLHV